MSIWYLLCLLSTLAVLIAFSNQFLVKTQPTIAITAGSLLMSMLLILAGKVFGTEATQELFNLVAEIDFKQFLLDGVLGVLLFAGALEIDLRVMKKQRKEIAVLVLFSTLVSTFIVAYLSYQLLGFMGWPVPFIYCLLFGALISPTDPIAVLAIIKQMKAPENISIQVEGESLFNDGVGLVLFTTILAVALSGTAPTAAGVAHLFLVDAIGGIAFGLVLAFVSHVLIIKSREANIRLLLTICIPTAGFATANLLGISGALAMVVSGIFIGNVTRGKAATMSRYTSVRNVRNFWHAIEGALNALLFLLIGLLLVTLPFTWEEISIGLLMIPIVLLARFISVSLPYLAFRRFRQYDVNAVRILTWGGLRGGLALAMAASIPAGQAVVNGTDIKTLLVTLTYVVVIFSIIVQASTIRPLIEGSIRASANKDS
ncbi:cation:proton antiporter [Pseudoalteromonas sp. T1lg88]|uniref:cation:proton antiporter n=1 Tax=Pseudoalteromonas sp. T1lg88 TaxID=2077104 RepID=UPI000CF5E523|nr:sodium:proton antiporter [Pseudoalteromonas sp. T1lg88]